MGLLSSIFGKTPSVSTPTLDQYNLGILSALKTTSTNQQKQSAMSSSLMDQIPGLVESVGQAPTLGDAENAELDIANQTYQSMLQMAQVNVINQQRGQLASTNSNLRGSGINTTGAGAQSLQSGIISQNQTSLNNYAANQASSLLTLRQNLLNNVYNRTTNQLSAVMAAQSQADSQASSNLGTLLSFDANERKLQFDTSAYNAQLKQADKAAKLSMVGGITSSLIGGFGSFGAGA